MATLLIEKNTLNVWTHTPSDFQPYILTQFYAKSNGDNFMVFEFSGVQRGSYHFSDISIKDGVNPIETGFTSVKQVMLRLEELLYVGFEFDGDVVPADLISTDPSNVLTTGTDNKLFVAGTGSDDTADHFRGNWNASTNTPTLTNGVGQIGDYYRVSVGGTQFSTEFEIGDIISYNGSTWYMFVNNHQSPVLTTNFNIASSDLTTQNVAGFVSYINSLVSSFSLEVNEIGYWSVTDTGQKFQLLLRGRSFGGSEPDIVSGDVLELEPNNSPQITITTSVSIDTTTLSSGISQKGRNVVISNGANAINYTVNASDGFAASFLKHGSATITFVQGSGRTLIQVSGTSLLNGAVGSTATISSVGTTDYLRISNI